MISIAYKALIEDMRIAYKNLYENCKEMNSEKCRYFES
jgi:hypothetical protein